MMRKWIAAISIFGLCLTPAQVCRADAVAKLSPHVSVCREAINGVLIEKDGRTLVIYGDPAGHVKTADKVLFTHRRRDVVWAGRKLVENGAEAVVPASEIANFTDVNDFWLSFVKKKFHDYKQQTTKILTRPLKVSQKVSGADVFRWQDIPIRVLDTPGYARGAISYFADIDGLKYGFVGDIIYGDGQLMDLYSLQDAVPEAKIGGYHGYAGRIGPLIQSLRKVQEQECDILVPARGPVIKNPKMAISRLIERLQAAYKNYLSINAGHWYFKDRYQILAERALGSAADVDWMPYATVIHEKPPNWIIPIHNSRLMLSEDGSGFLVDCGSAAIIRELVELRQKGRLRRLDGLFITHYHDDHTDKVNELVEEFACPVYACNQIRDILQHPDAYRLPAMTANPITTLTTVPDGYEMRWKQFKLTFYHFPGQTLYHDALLAERAGGEKIFFIGDSFTPSGIDDYCLQNRNLLHEQTGYFYCLDLLRKMPPDYLLINEHVVEPFRFSKDQLDHMKQVLQKRKRILADLFPWDEPNYGIDERWARIYPYGRKARPGQNVKIGVRILNHSPAPETYFVTLHVPEGLTLKRQSASITIQPRREAEVPFRITAPDEAPKTLYVITADIRFGKWQLHHWCESLIEIGP
jgi:glyoxylase-like metal-dependent hydrolase (beta-lactamase superfamily II)